MAEFTVLHYTGYDDDRGGIVSVIRAVAATARFDCLLGVNAGCVQTRHPPLPVLPLPRIAGERIGVLSAWHARTVALAVRPWLAEDLRRVFHGHSRAGLLVALWLHRMGERRVVVSVHCYGRQRWFYRWSARRLAGRQFWLSPAMRSHYGGPGAGWSACIPSCVAPDVRPVRRERPGDSQVVRLGGIGALVAWKGWDLIVTAIALLPPRVRARIRFQHIGVVDGSSESERYSQRLRAQTQQSGVDGFIRWSGPCPSAAPLLAEVDCLVVASRNEPFSVAMLEALHAGVPVLAADSGGALDVISPEVNGWLFRTGRPEDLARHLAALTEPGAMDRVSIDAASLSRFSAASVADAYAAAYRTVVPVRLPRSA